MRAEKLMAILSLSLAGASAILVVFLHGATDPAVSLALVALATSCVTLIAFVSKADHDKRE